MCEFYKSVLETLVGNFILTLLLICYNEFFNSKKNISGEWETVLNIEKTTYQKYNGISIKFKIHLLQQGDEIVGYGEKISDTNNERGEYYFEETKRVHVEIKGYYERNYIRKSLIYLNVLENGRLRDSTESFSLVVKSNKLLSGTFVTTAANASGKVIMNKNVSDI